MFDARGVPKVPGMSNVALQRSHEISRPWCQMKGNFVTKKTKLKSCSYLFLFRSCSKKSARRSGVVLHKLKNLWQWFFISIFGYFHFEFVLLTCQKDVAVSMEKSRNAHKANLSFYASVDNSYQALAFKLKFFLRTWVLFRALKVSEVKFLPFGQ